MAMHTLAEDFLTVAEAAEQMQVAPSTMRRWIREGDLPAYRIGKRRVGVRREDLRALIQPAAEADSTHRAATPTAEQLGRHKLTPEEKRRGLEAMDRIERLQEKIMEERGGELFPESWELINEARDERTRQLNDCR